MEKFKKIIKGLFWCFTGFNRYNCVYKIVAYVGLVLRVGLLPFLIPSIFDVIADYFIAQLGLPSWLYEILMRLVLFLVDAIGVSHIFYWASYFTVGNFYESCTIPAYGSACYTIFYFIYMGIPVLLINYFYWWVIALTFVIYLAICIGVYILSGKIDVIPDDWMFRAATHGTLFIVIVVATFLLKAFAFN